MSIAEKFEVIADAVYDKGYSQSESDFWDKLQNYGNRVAYDEVFRYWQGDYLRPKYKIVPTSCLGDAIGFMRFACSSNIKIAESKYIDFSQLTIPVSGTMVGYRQTFQGCKQLEVVEDIGFQPATYYYTFQGCSVLHTIEKIRCREEGSYGSAFSNCPELRNISIEGVIGRNISFSHSTKLTIESMKSIITHLKDYSVPEEASNKDKYSITLSSTSKTALEGEGETSPLGTLWTDYVESLGWKLA